MTDFARLSNEEIRDGLMALPNWKEPVLMSILIPYYALSEFNEIEPKREGAKLAQVLRLFGLIEPREDRRYGISARGKAFVKWAIDGKILTAFDGADFIIRHGEKFGRRIMFDPVFVPDTFKKPVAEEKPAEVPKA